MFWPNSAQGQIFKVIDMQKRELSHLYVQHGMQVSMPLTISMTYTTIVRNVDACNQKTWHFETNFQGMVVMLSTFLIQQAPKSYVKVILQV